jgi:2-iminobutanoate/2-iminopropanoate deaminase
MEERIVIKNDKIPPAIGPYSPAVKVGNMLFISGQLPIDPKTGNIVGGDIQKQNKQVLENLKVLLELYSFASSNIVKTTVFLKNMNNFTKFNYIYAKYFKENFPVRSGVEVSRLPKDANIETEAIAMQQFCY